MGAVLNEKGDRTGAAEHLRKYLELAPKADDVAVVTAHLDDLKAGTRLSASAARHGRRCSHLLWIRIFRLSATPGFPVGMKALAKVARLKAVPSYENFFLEYCRAISIETSKTNNMRTPGYSANLRAYMAAVAELTSLGEQHGDKTVITLSLADPAHLQKAKQILASARVEGGRGRWSGAARAGRSGRGRAAAADSGGVRHRRSRHAAGSASRQELPV